MSNVYSVDDISISYNIYFYPYVLSKNSRAYEKEKERAPAQYVFTFKYPVYFGKIRTLMRFF